MKEAIGRSSAILWCPKCGNTERFRAVSALHVDIIDGGLNVLRTDYNSFEEFVCYYCGANVVPATDLADECISDY